MGKNAERSKWRIFLPAMLLILIAGMAVKAHAGQFTMQYNDTYVSGAVSGSGVDYYLLPASQSGYADITYQQLTASSNVNSVMAISSTQGKAGANELYGQVVGGGTRTWRYRVWLSNTTADGNLWVKIYLSKGSYAQYRIKASFTAVSGANVTEPNNTLARAMRINGGNTYTTSLSHNDSSDYYTFSLSKRQAVTISITSQISKESWPAAITGWSGPFTLPTDPGQIRAILYNGQRVAISNNGKWTVIRKAYLASSVTSTIYSGTLPAGNYYIGVSKPVISRGNIVAYQNNGIYSVRVNASTSSSAVDPTPDDDDGKVTLSKSSVKIVNGKTYTLSAYIDGKKTAGSAFAWGTSDAKVATVSNGRIKAVGLGSAVISAISSGGQTAACTVVVKPAAVSNLRLRSTKTSGKMRMLWNKIDGVTGYQVELSTAKNFKSKKAKTITSASKAYTSYTGLKKNRRYYVRVRAYITISGTKHYGPWSKVVSKVQKN